MDDIAFRNDFNLVCTYSDTLPDVSVGVEGFRKTVRVCQYALTTFGINYGTELFRHWNNHLMWKWEERDVNRFCKYVIEHNDF